MNRTRAASVAPTALLVLVLLVVAGLGVWGLVRASTRAGATAAPSATPAATPAGAPSEDAGRLADDALRVFALGAIPADHRFTLVGDIGDERLLLLDLSEGTVRVAAHFEGPGAFPSQRRLDISATSDGRTVLLSLRSDAATSRLYAIRPLTGEAVSFLVPRAAMARGTPDGTTVAAAHDDPDPERHGVWRFDATTGIGVRWVGEPPSRRASTPIAWSADGRRLAVLQDPEGRDPRVAVLGEGIDGLRVLGPGTGARWRGSELLVWSALAPGSGVVAYDVASGAVRPAYPADAGATTERIEPRPGSTDVAAVERRAAGRPSIVLHGSAAAAAELAIPDDGQLIALWWSADGRRLYAWTNDNGTTTVTDTMSGTAAVRFCLRLRVAPPCG